MSRVLVIFHTFSGNTEKMARAVAEGAKEIKGTDVVLKKAGDTDPQDLAAADAVAFGAPNTFGGAAGALKDFFDRAWTVHEQVAGKPAVAFSSENPGETGALKEIEKFFTFFGLNKISDGVVAANAPGTEELEKCKNIGQNLAKATGK